MGCKTRIYSNEAGQVTAPHQLLAANVSHPAKQGLVQSFSVYIDTLWFVPLLVLFIIDRKKYNVQKSGFGTESASRFCMKEQKMLLWVQDIPKVPWIVFCQASIFTSLRLPCFFFFALLRFWPITILPKQIFRI
jgi:Na+/alanine symporter